MNQTASRPGFPYYLTLAAAFVFIIMIGLGVWQVRRFQWKERVLAKLETLRNAPPQPIGPVLARAARGENVALTRVAANCGAAPARGAIFSMGVEAGQYVWRPQSLCRLAAPPFDGIVIDRGVLEASRGLTQPTAAVLPAPMHVEGVLREAASPPMAGAARPAPFLLVAERESPPAPGVTPSPPVSNIPDNLQYVGEYAPTWFGLAGVLACFYGAMLWRRFRS